MEQEQSASEHMKFIFDLCDADNDGVITVEDFRRIGLEHLAKSQRIELLIKVMDPDSSGYITFDKFSQGIEAFLLEQQQNAAECASLSSSFNETASLGAEFSDSMFSGDDVYPFNLHNGSCLSNGYEPTDASGSTVELVVDPALEELTSHLGSAPHHHSSPLSLPTSSTPVQNRHSPTQLARTLLQRHSQLTLPPDLPSSSQASTPAELADEEVSVLSDQLLELSSKLDELQEDQKDSKDHRVKLKKENTLLKHKLEEYEELLRHSEQTNRELLDHSHDRVRLTELKVRRESAYELDEVRVQLLASRGRVSELQDVEAALRSQLTQAREELGEREREAGVEEERRREVERELEKTRRQLKTEREKWTEEKDTIEQDLHSREQHLQQLQRECEDALSDRKTNSITASDMSREIDRLRKELDRSERRCEELQGQFLQHGQQLLATAAGSSKQSLAAEMETASRDQVLRALEEREELVSRLHSYIDGLLSTIIEHCPQLLERH